VARLEQNGIGIAPGVGIGSAVLVRSHSTSPVPQRKLQPDEAAEAWQRLEAARQAAIGRLGEIQSATARELGIQDAAIYGAQAAVLQDPDAVRDLKQRVLEEFVAPESAVQALLDKFGALFESLEGGDMKTWAADLRDPWHVVLRELGDEEEVRAGGSGPLVVVAEELTPTLLTRFPREDIVAVVCTRGGRFSHGAVVARSFGIPTVSGLDAVHTKVRSGERCVVLGREGRLLAGATAEEQEEAASLAEDRRRMQGALALTAGEPGRTRDGHPVRVLANIESPRDLDMFDPATVAGIGLFRTEFAYMERASFPTAKEQKQLYAAVLERFPGKPVVFRTLDVGGDKTLRYFHTPEEANPALGWRGLRLSLEWQDLFLMQLQALADCRELGNPHVLLPMVTTVEELLRAKEMLATVVGDGPALPLGVMIEVPAAAMALEDIVEEVDFVSVGTNDLTQYLFAVDRDNPWVADLFQPYHPANLRVLAHIGRICQEAGKPASVCGEMAGQRPGALFLAGAGFEGLSMAPAFAPEIKALLREADLEELRVVAEEAAACRTGEEAVERLGTATDSAWERAMRRLDARS
jgi:phosphotransferase system enzyme I (PtsI)